MRKAFGNEATGPNPRPSRDPLKPARQARARADRLRSGILSLYGHARSSWPRSRSHPAGTGLGRLRARPRACDRGGLGPGMPRPRSGPAGTRDPRQAPPAEPVAPPVDPFPPPVAPVPPPEEDVPPVVPPLPPPAPVPVPPPAAPGAPVPPPLAPAPPAVPDDDAVPDPWVAPPFALWWQAVNIVITSRELPTAANCFLIALLLCRLCTRHPKRATIASHFSACMRPMATPPAGPPQGPQGRHAAHWR